MHSRISAAFGAAVLASACAYQAETITAPAHNVYLSYAEKLPGKWLLYVDDQSLSKTVRPSDMNCAAHTFPLDYRGPFRNSIRQTLLNVVDEIEDVPSPVARDELGARGARGMIIVRGEDMDARLRLVPGFWNANIETDARIVASVVVEGRRERLLGQTVEGQGRGDTSAGMFCEGGGRSLGEASSDALRDVVRKLGEAVGNSERVRSGA